LPEVRFKFPAILCSGFEGRPGAHMNPSRITWNKGKFEQTRRRRSADSRKCAREGARARVRPNLNPTSLAPNEAGSSSETPYMPRTARCQTDGRTNAEVALRVIKRSREHHVAVVARSVMARWSQWLGGRSILGVGVVAHVGELIVQASRGLRLPAASAYAPCLRKVACHTVKCVGHRPAPSPHGLESS
jgi:hypothetical protein